MADNFEPVLLRETETLQVWQTSIEPGESFSGQDHEVGYVVVVLEGDEITVKEPSGEGQQMTVYPGEVLVGGPSPRHMVTNTGNVRYREIVVELKEH